MTSAGLRVVLVLYRSRRMVDAELQRALTQPLDRDERQRFTHLARTVRRELQEYHGILVEKGLVKPYETRPSARP